jgi:spore germination cell wall hydrolase CwlJ-like protein
MSKFGKAIDKEVNEQGRKMFKSFLSGMLFGFLLGAVMFAVPRAYASDPNNEMYCMAQNIYFEAGNQPLAGKIAVSQVVLNRVKHPSYPDNICDVVYQAKMKVNWKNKIVPIRNQCQFSWFCDGKSDDPVDSQTWLSALHIARDVVQERYGDITEGSTHYHADSVHPYWADSLYQTVIINNHTFYK